MLEKILEKKSLLITFLTILVIGGIGSFSSLSKLEDPEIPVKAAVVITPYPGASTEEVDLEVTQLMEEAIQKLENIDYIESRSIPGMSQITVTLEGKVTTEELPQIWDHLRRKVNDASSGLPAGAGTPIVNDDFGDVYGIFLAVSSDGYSYKELDNYTDFLRKELLQVKGVKRIEVVGEQNEVVNISFSAEKFANLGINPMSIAQTLNDEAEVVDAGSAVSGTERLRINVGTKLRSISEVENLNIFTGDGRSFRLGDIATVSKDFYRPKQSGLSFNSRAAMGLAISMESGDNIIKLGERVDSRLTELKPEIPVGIEVHKIYDQPSKVQDSISDFTINLIESVAIVIIVLLIAMGFRAGLLIASSLIFTILSTFIIMNFLDMTLDKVSLAAIIIAMGMLVDNAIVVVDGILADMQKGIKRHKAFVMAAKQNAFPLLGATIITILAFMPMAFNTTAAGEFMKPLFFVLTISLIMSWMLAMIQAPFMASLFYKKGKRKKKKEDTEEIYSGGFYRYFKKIISFALWHKSLVAIATILILVISFWAFRFINKDFFPVSNFNQFMVEYSLPDGSDIYQVEKDLEYIQKNLLQWEEVTKVTTALGSSPVRYTLARPMNSYNPGYGELIVETNTFEETMTIMPRIEAEFSERFPNSTIRCRQYSAIGGDYKIQAMFSGPDSEILRDLAERAKKIMNNEPTAVFVNDSWGNKVKNLAPIYAPEKARPLNISRNSIASALAIASEGMPIGAFYEEDTQLPILLKLEPSLADNPANIGSVPVWGNYSKSSVPLAQITDSLSLTGQNYLISRYDGIRSVKAQCDPVRGMTTPEVMEKIRPEIEALELPEGYTLEWHGELKDSNTANQALMENLPLALLLMVLITIALFNNFRQPTLIFLIVPLAFIGIIAGFLITRLNFGFVAIIGGLGLIGMMIKNTVVLLDQINIDINSGKEKLEAILGATVSRVRPVTMASLTTILGMFPLLFDEMFQGMAVSIMFGLLFGTVITLVIVPVLYAVFYKVDTRAIAHHDDLPKNSN
ncbi:efflux RND transporter permease subunit [Marinilabilia salmonicolor]|uniref:efflux RND transporter permease subunit n=1 Tax=Marinilabilia salmonicolor TaxID=989 RepID=UPI00029A4761|nr:efflux RND transporter permease subunit [Marinilabilia salmonicolor]